MCKIELKLLPEISRFVLLSIQNIISFNGLNIRPNIELFWKMFIVDSCRPGLPFRKGHEHVNL